ncbi:MAG TPA: hypothetical protein VEL47_08215 [Myxococcota bacterium]|nr:hypothetical protein [Myxococcota bacterium]
MLSGTAHSEPGDYGSKRAQYIIDLIKNDEQNRSTFCSAGAKSIIHTIRSYEGTYCEDSLKAALAYGACKDYGTFNESKCYPKALKILKTYASLHQAGMSLTNAALDIIASELSSSVEPVCDAITAFLPDLAFKCMLVQQYKPTTTPPARPLTPLPTEGEKTPAETSSLPEIGHHRVPSEASSLPKLGDAQFCQKYKAKYGEIADLLIAGPNRAMLRFPEGQQEQYAAKVAECYGIHFDTVNMFYR